MSAPVQKSGKSKRSRIVVSFEKAREMAHVPERGTRSRSVMGIVAVVLGVLVVGAVVGGYFWWRSYKTKPAYSLALLVDAAQRNDAKAVDEIIDTDKIVENFIPQVTEKALERYAAALTGPLGKQVEALVPKLLPEIKDKVREEAMNRVKEVGKRAEGKPFILVALAMPYAVSVNQNGDAAKVVANFEGRPTELTMERHASGRWKIVAVKDETLATRMVDNIARDLPPVGSEGEKPPGPGEDRSGKRPGRRQEH